MNRCTIFERKSRSQCRSQRLREPAFPAFLRENSTSIFRGIFRDLHRTILSSFRANPDTVRYRTVVSFSAKKVSSESIDETSIRARFRSIHEFLLSHETSFFRGAMVRTGSIGENLVERSIDGSLSMRVRKGLQVQ